MEALETTRLGRSSHSSSEHVIDGNLPKRKTALAKCAFLGALGLYEISQLGHFEVDVSESRMASSSLFFLKAVLVDISRFRDRDNVIYDPIDVIQLYRQNTGGGDHENETLTEAATRMEDSALSLTEILSDLYNGSIPEVVDALRLRIMGEYNQLLTTYIQLSTGESAHFG